HRRNDRRQRARPGGPGPLGPDQGGIIGDIDEEPPPARVDRAGIFEITGVELRDELGVAAGEKTGSVDVGHRKTSVLRAPDSPRRGLQTDTQAFLLLYVALQVWKSDGKRLNPGPFPAISRCRVG